MDYDSSKIKGVDALICKLNQGRDIIFEIPLEVSILYHEFVARY